MELDWRWPYKPTGQTKAYTTKWHIYLDLESGFSLTACKHIGGISDMTPNSTTGKEGFSTALCRKLILDAFRYINPILSLLILCSELIHRRQRWHCLRHISSLILYICFQRTVIYYVYFVTCIWPYVYYMHHPIEILKGSYDISPTFLQLFNL